MSSSNSNHIAPISISSKDYRRMESELDRIKREAIELGWVDIAKNVDNLRTAFRSHYLKKSA